MSKRKSLVSVLVIFVLVVLGVLFKTTGVEIPVWFSRSLTVLVDSEDSAESADLNTGNEGVATAVLSPQKTTADVVYTPTPRVKSEISPNEVAEIDFSVLPDGRLDINIANRKQLMDLPGIGEKLSLRIIEYRDLNGPFIEFSELLNVNGIKPDVYETLKMYAGTSFE